MRGGVNSRSVMAATAAELTDDFLLNSVSPLLVSRAFVPLLVKSSAPSYRQYIKYGCCIKFSRAWRLQYVQGRCIRYVAITII